jgi:hypothetical protein
MLIFPKHPTLFEHLVYQRGFSMINMGDNGDIPDFALIHLRLCFDRPEGAVHFRDQSL